MERELVLNVIREAGKPIAAGEVATLSGLDRKVVDKVFAELKKDGSIISPVRCKWTPAQQNWFIEEVNIKSPAYSAGLFIIVPFLIQTICDRYQVQTEGKR